MIQYQGRRSFNAATTDSGEVKLDFELAFGDITLGDIPNLVPIVQRQQKDLSFLCNSSHIHSGSTFHERIQHFSFAPDFLIGEITSESVYFQMEQLKEKHSWVDDEGRLYFELV